MSRYLSSLLIIIYALAISGCQPAGDHGFAIYLLARDIPATELSQIDINQLVLESKPVISAEDVISYDRTDHRMELTQAAFSRVQQLFTIPVKVDGLPFVVCVGKERIYTGAFWTPVSSLSYDGVVIMQPLESNGRMIQIDLGYPVPEVFAGNDPRADPRILNPLEQDGKLK